LVQKPVGRRPLERNMRKREDNIKMGLWEVGWEYGLDWFVSGKEEVEGSCYCGNEPLDSTKCGQSLD
jgi:hypothetical protein